MHSQPQDPAIFSDRTLRSLYRQGGHSCKTLSEFKRVNRRLEELYALPTSRGVMDEVRSLETRLGA